MTNQCQDVAQSVYDATLAFQVANGMPEEYAVNVAAHAASAWQIANMPPEPAPSYSHTGPWV
jgi:hypothetical protein